VVLTKGTIFPLFPERTENIREADALAESKLGTLLTSRQLYQGIPTRRRKNSDYV
jgi:hypothetical protein